MAARKKKTEAQLADIATGHQTYLQKLAASWANVSVKEINATERDMILYIQDFIRNFGSIGLDKKTEAKFAMLEKQIKTIRKPGINAAYVFILDDGKNLAENESKWINEYTGALTGEAGKTITATAAANIPKYGNYNGHSIQGWFNKLGDDEAFKITGAVRTGLANGDSMAAMIRTIQGTAEQGFRDGIIETTRREATNIARTACNGVANDAKMAFYEENQNLISFLVYTATLDSRTSLICASLDGTKWKVPEDMDKVRTPPLHHNCRSTLLPQTPLAGETTRPAANADFERLAREEYNAKYPGKKFDDLAPSTRKKYFYEAQDAYEVRTGKPAYSNVNKSTTWSDWFSRQSATDQREYLGATRYKAYKSGEYNIKDYVNPDNSKPYSVAELKVMDKKAFE